MKTVRSVLILAIIVVCGSAFQAIGAGSPLFPIATLTDLLSHPAPVPASDRPAARLFYASVVPEIDMVVVLRPITEEEYGSFQVQAIGHQIIERRMLAAAIVLPLVTAADIAGFSPEITLFLKRQINAISGFAVFPVPLP